MVNQNLQKNLSFTKKSNKKLNIRNVLIAGDKIFADADWSKIMTIDEESMVFFMF